LAITKSSGSASGAGQGKELERLEELARNQLALVSMLDSIQSLLFRVLFDTTSEMTLEFRESTPSEVSTVLSFLGSIFGHLTSSSARLYSRLVLARRDSFIGSMRTDLGSALRSAPLSTSGLFGRAAEAAWARVDQDNSSLAMANMAQLASRLQEGKNKAVVPRTHGRGRGQEVSRYVASSSAFSQKRSSRGRGRGRGRGSSASATATRPGQKGSAPQ
jgi:hypothetical protein